MDLGLAGTVDVVTDVSKGIGGAIAVQLACEGPASLSRHRVGPFEATALLIMEMSVHEVFSLQGDVTAAADVRR